MKTKTTSFLLALPALLLTLALMASVAMAQTESASTKSLEAKSNATSDSSKKTEPKKSDKAKKSETIPTNVDTGEEAGGYTIVSSIEFGYRGLRVGGSENKFRSDLNYKAGPRIFDSSFLAKSKDGKGRGLFDTLLVNSTGWGADPYSNMRVSMENGKWYRFDATYRRFKYFNFLNNLANPFTSSNPTSGVPVLVLPNPVAGKHGFNVKQQLGDFDITILPKNERFSFNFGYSPERYSGLTYTTYHSFGGEFFMPATADSRANDFRVGANWKLGPIDFSFLQGFRRYQDDSSINFNGTITSYLATSATNVATVNSLVRQQPMRGSTDYSRFSAHTMLAKKVDITGRFIYSNSNIDFTFNETSAGVNWNTRVTGAPTTGPASGVLTYTGHTKRPNVVGDLGVTFFATDKLKFSNTVRFESFHINGSTFYTSNFSLTKTGGVAVPIIASGILGTSKITSYRKITDTIEGDYQISRHYALHFGYRRGERRETAFYDGYNPGAYTPARVTPDDEVEQNHTNVFFGGFKAQPVKGWSLYFDAERGTADNIFTRWGNYDYTNFRVKSRYMPNRKLNLNLGLVMKDNSDPANIEGVSLADFGVSVKSRVFTSDLTYSPNARMTFTGGYNYNWLNSDVVINYAYALPPFPSGAAGSAQASIRGDSLYFVRNNYFYLEATARLNQRMTLYSAYRVNKDNGQGDSLSSPKTVLATPLAIPGSTSTIAANGTVITSYPMSFQSPEVRLAVKLNRRLDWNLGYQYFNYNESKFIRTFGGNAPAQNYHAHLPYMSLRLYIGRKE